MEDGLRNSAAAESCERATAGTACVAILPDQQSSGFGGAPPQPAREGAISTARSEHHADVNSFPLVSCVMPTRNRRRFVSQSIWYFLRQDYSRKELIILDDGEDSVADLVPADDRIRYLRLDRRLSIGAKRNLGCEMSGGEMIANWDDDDWIGPDRLSLQVRRLLGTGADLCGLRDLLHYKPEAGEAWLYRYPEDARPWLAGGTLLYRRAAWAESRFPEIDVGEDTAFVWQQPAERITIMPDLSFYVALIHRGNTSGKHLTDVRWQRRPLDDVSRLLAPDRDFYVSLRNGPDIVPRRPRDAETITFGAPFLTYDGYGSMAEFAVLGIERAGGRVNVVPLALDLNGLSDEFKQILHRSRPDRSAPTLYFSWPNPDLEQFRHAPELFIYTMWESSRLPADWPERLNRARAVIVPTRFCARVCRDSGVDVPVKVVPLGADPNVYRLHERPERRGLTSLVIGTLAGRKHVCEAIAGWKLAFAGDPDARLIIKSRFHYGHYVPDDPRILFVDSNETTRGIAHWYQQADVLIAVGNEGFGLPLVEAMASGLPVVALNSEGQSDVCEDAGPDCLLPIEPERWEASNDAPFGPAGVRGVPGVEAIAECLRWVAGHRAEAREMGRRASEWVVRHRNIWTTGPAILNVIECNARTPRALKQTYKLLVPSWQTRCGVAEYAKHLCESLPNLEATAEISDVRGARVLHVQHEPSLFDDTKLTALVQKARANRVPLAITQHTIGRQLHAWEREADVLVTLGRRGAVELRERWPGKRVECIPCGCPTWFPARKSKRGRVIGAFGFLEAHKGFWQLLDVLRALPGTELFLISHSKHPGQDARWSNAAEGLPVRHCKEFLPVAEAARLLAAEADVLAFWYDESAHVSTSSAARVGLATGVPVVTSPTAWFDDLRDVTLQPRNLVEGIGRLLDDHDLEKNLTEAARNYCNENSWSRTAERHLALWQSMEVHH
jgi:glycosyltransferase involved in cell wall biosynthesis